MSVETKSKTTFEDVQAAINQVPNINQGGCGIAALAMARWIKKNNPNWMTYLFVMGHDDVGAFKLNAEVLANTTKLEPTSASHIGLIVYDHEKNTQKIVDCNTIFNMLQYKYVNTFHSEKVLLKSINRVDHWNKDFDRINVASIANVLDIDLSDIDCRTNKEYCNNAALAESPEGVKRKDKAAEEEIPISLIVKYVQKFMKRIAMESLES